jgi:phage-related protein
MKLVNSEFDKNDKSVEATAARNAVLNKEIDAQKAKMDMLREALQNASESFGEADARTQRWQIELNNAQTGLNRMERELADTSDSADDLGDGLRESGESAEKSESKFSNLGSVLKGVGVAMGAVVVAAGAAAIKMGAEVVQQFAELEQNLGGSEAVFGEYAASIQKTGEEAYKNLGVSQSDYLATANKMGALFQGSGIEQQKSLELTTKSMQRAADMASVMGIDMQVALDSVAGAAKGNFTMMDNLGVSMNATSIQAYAVANGLDFVWAKASQAEKAEAAMQMFFESTEQYAGNFANEATQTVSGSIGLMQAALGSFTAGLGNADADMTNLTENLVDAFQAVVANVTPILENIVTALPESIGAILQAVSDLLPMLLETATQLFEQVLQTIFTLLPELIPAVVQAVMTIVNAIIENLPLLIDGAIQLITALVDGIRESLPQLIPAAIEAITTIVEGLIDNLPLLLDAALQLIIGLTEGLLQAIPTIIEKLPEIITAIYEFLISSIPEIIDAGVTLLIALVDNLPAIIDGVVEAIPKIVMGLANAFSENIDKIIDAGVTLLVALVQNLPKITIEVLKAIPKIVTSIFNEIISNKDKIADAGLDLIKGLWQGISDAGAWLREKISGFFGGVVDNIKNFFGIHSPSTLFRDEIGANLALGVAAGIQAKSEKAVKAAQKMSKDTFNAASNWIEQYRLKEEYSAKEELAMWEYLTESYAENTDERIKIDKSIAKIKEDIRKEEAKREEEQLKEEKRKSEERLKIIGKMEDAEKKYQNAIASRASSIAGSFGIFDELKEKEKVSGADLAKNLQGQLDEIQNWTADLATLTDKGINEGLLAQLQSMGPKASAEIAALSKMTEDELTEYSETWQKIQDAATGQATLELQPLRDETNEVITGLMDDLNELNYEGIGDAVSNGIKDGLTKGLEEGISTITAVLTATGGVFTSLGEKISQEIGSGFSSRMKIVAQDFQNSIPTSLDAPTINQSVVTSQREQTEALVNGLGTILAGSQQSSSAGQPLILQINGTELARILLPFSRLAGTQTPAIVADF